MSTFLTAFTVCFIVTAITITIHKVNMLYVERDKEKEFLRHASDEVRKEYIETELLRKK